VRLEALYDGEDPFKLWDVARHAEVTALTTHKALVHPVVLSPDGKRLASGHGEEWTR
jgi:hypothetical protein